MGTLTLDATGAPAPAPLPPNALAGFLSLRAPDGREVCAAIGLALAPDGIRLDLRAVILVGGGTLPTGGRVTATYPPLAAVTFGRTLTADGNTPAPAFVAELVEVLGLFPVV
jgi:hypothetical protein